MYSITMQLHTTVRCMFVVNVGPSAIWCISLLQEVFPAMERFFLQRDEKQGMYQTSLCYSDQVRRVATSMSRLLTSYHGRYAHPNV